MKFVMRFAFVRYCKGWWKIALSRANMEETEDMLPAHTRDHCSSTVFLCVFFTE